MATFEIPKFDFKGIRRIEIPKLDKDFASQDYGLSIIKKYLPKVLNIHSENAKKIKYLYDFFLGDQDILAKQRRYQTDAYNNNQIIENHANRQVEFKVGFLTGEQREYSHKADSDTDDLMFLDRYFSDCGFFKKDKSLKKWVYATGIGVSYTAPRVDIIVDDGVDAITGTKKTRYATAQEGFDIKFNAPFTFSVLDPKDNFVVYSSSFDKEPLFCVSIVDVDISRDDAKDPEIGKQMLIETRYASFVVQSDNSYLSFYWDKPTFSVLPKAFPYLPMIEYSVNDDRIGVVELNRSLFNSINTFRSAVADMTVDSANAILVFKNVDIESEEVKEMKKAGAIIISDGQNARQGGTADLDTITLEIPFDGLNSYIDQLLTNCYDIAGVPLASGQVTSGGDTGQARLLGGGWNNAYTMANNDITSLKGFDYEELKLILLICKQVPSSPLNELHASQIDINYRINQNDNYLTKTQGMMSLYSINMPKEEILKTSKLFNDIKTVAKKWQEYEDKKLADQKSNETKLDVDSDLPRPDNRVVGANQGNNSQE